MTFYERGKKERHSHIWQRDKYDWYIEPEWTSGRLFKEVIFRGPIYDPACGSGRIVKAARDAGYQADGSDIVRRSEYCNFEDDFLMRPKGSFRPGSIVTNPPFKHARAFAERALEVALHDVAMILPITWICGNARSTWLETTPLAKILVMTPRPSMPSGEAIAAGMIPGGGTGDFAWYIWRHGHEGPWTGEWLRRDG